MATTIRLRIFALFLHLFILQEMITMFGEAALCESRSRLFRGACFSNRNCGGICEKEGFLNGRCKFLKCTCSKDCNGGGGGGGGGGEGGGGGGAGGGGEGGGGEGGGGEAPPGEGPPNEGPTDGGDSPPASGGDGPPGNPAPPKCGPPRKMMQI